MGYSTVRVFKLLYNDSVFFMNGEWYHSYN